MEINGLPLHPLAVHAAVVFAPLAALCALGFLIPRLQDRLRSPTLVLAVVAALSIVGAVLSGDSFREANDFFNDPTLATTDTIDTHEKFGRLLLWVSLGFAALAAVNTWLLDRIRRSGALRVVLQGLLAIAAVAVLVLVVLTGDAGASAVWDGFSG